MKMQLQFRHALTCLAVALFVGGCNDQSSNSASNLTSTAQKGANAATLSWEAPTTNTNGSALTDLAGYRIYYGPDPRSMSQSVQIKTTGVQTYMIDNLSAGTWYFAIMAVTSAGTESSLSNIVSMTVGS
jgi:Fibronectin type III domain